MKARSPVLILMLLLGWVLAGCERGPTEDAMAQDLQGRLDTHFQSGLFTIADFKRTGSAPFRDLENGVGGVHSYYDAQLQFLQDYGLTQWQGLNLGTLAYAIGATEAGIDGFHARGNSRGDMLRVHGRFSYSEDGRGTWQALDQEPVPSAAMSQETGGDRHGRGAKAILADTRALLAQPPEVRPGSGNAILIEELGGALNRIDLRFARLEHKITLGSGPPHGTYYTFGEALGHYAGQQKVALFSATSEGSVANASRLQAGRLDFGLVQSDVAQLLYEGWKGEGFYPNRDLRAVASLWPEAVHLLTLEGSGIEQLADLRQRRIAIGQRGSGSRVNALLIGMAAGLEAAELPAIREISLSRAIRQLEQGEVDALFLTEAIPAPAIQALAARRTDLRFVPISHDVVARLSERHFAYYPLTVAARTYPGQAEAFATLGLAAALMTHAHVADDRVEQVLELLLDGGDELARKYYRAAFISRETMRLGLAVPLHPAAERFYERYDRQQNNKDGH